jgi:hypothetical protein
MDVSRAGSKGVEKAAFRRRDAIPNLSGPGIRDDLTSRYPWMADSTMNRPAKVGLASVGLASGGSGLVGLVPRAGLPRDDWPRDDWRVELPRRRDCPNLGRWAVMPDVKACRRHHPARHRLLRAHHHRLLVHLRHLPSLRLR